MDQLTTTIALKDEPPCAATHFGAEIGVDLASEWLNGCAAYMYY